MIFMAKKAMYGPKQKLLIHAAKGYFEPILQNAAMCAKACDLRNADLSGGTHSPRLRQRRKVPNFTIPQRKKEANAH